MRMMVFIMCAFLALVAVAAVQAQTTLAGKMQCAKPDPNYSVPVTDQANHAMSLGVTKVHLVTGRHKRCTAEISQVLAGWSVTTRRAN